MLVKMTAVLVKIAVMMMAPGRAPAPPEARGRDPPPFFFFLDLLPRWEKGFPSGPWLPWLGRGESPSEIGSISLFLSVSAFSDPSTKGYTQQNHHLHQHLHHLPPSIFSGPLSRIPLYPLLEHGALCFILLSNDVLPSYDV